MIFLRSIRNRFPKERKFTAMVPSWTCVPDAVMNGVESVWSGVDEYPVARMRNRVPRGTPALRTDSFPRAVTGGVGFTSADPAIVASVIPSRFSCRIRPSPERVIP